jgi:hypothetical protein
LPELPEHPDTGLDAAKLLLGLSEEVVAGNIGEPIRKEIDRPCRLQYYKTLLKKELERSNASESSFSACIDQPHSSLVQGNYFV